MSDLIVIEAPGKIRRMYELCSSMGITATVIATLGHLFDNPRSFKQPAIGWDGDEFAEPLRQAVRPDVLRRIDLELSRCTGRIIVATDLDREGHVIADDIQHRCHHLTISTPLYRLTMRALTPEAFAEGMANLSPISSSLAVPGHARRITDRLITEVCSDLEKHLPVGRIQTAALALAEKGIAMSEVKMTIPAEQGLPYTCIADVPRGVSPAALISQLEAAAPLKVLRTHIEPLNEPPTGDSMVLALSSEMKMSISEAAKLLQDLYEQGKISYHRTQGRGYSEQTKNRLAQFAVGRGLIAFKKSTLPSQLIGEAHEAISVLHPESVDLLKPISLHVSQQDAALSIIAKANLGSGVSVQRDYADVANLNFVSGPLVFRQQRVALPWKQPLVNGHEVVSFSPDQALYRVLVQNGLGTPGTRPLLTDKLTSLDCPYLNKDLSLTTKGRAVLEQAPEALKDILNHSHIEDALQNEDEEISVLVEKALLMVFNNDQERLNEVIESLEEKITSPQLTPRF